MIFTHYIQSANAAAMPITPGAIRTAMNDATEAAESENFATRHLLSSLYVLQAIVLSILTTLSHVIVGTYNLISNLVMFRIPDAFVSLGEDILGLGRNVLFVASATTALFFGIFFPGSVYFLFSTIDDQTPYPDEGNCTECTLPSSFKERTIPPTPTLSLLPANRSAINATEYSQRWNAALDEEEDWTGDVDNPTDTREVVTQQLALVNPLKPHFTPSPFSFLVPDRCPTSFFSWLKGLISRANGSAIVPVPSREVALLKPFSGNLVVKGNNGDVVHVKLSFRVEQHNGHLPEIVLQWEQNGQGGETRVTIKPGRIADRSFSQQIQSEMLDALQRSAAIPKNIASAILFPALTENSEVDSSGVLADPTTSSLVGAKVSFFADGHPRTTTLAFQIQERKGRYRVTAMNAKGQSVRWTMRQEWTPESFLGPLQGRGGRLPLTDKVESDIKSLLPPGATSLSFRLLEIDEIEGRGQGPLRLDAGFLDGEEPDDLHEFMDEYRREFPVAPEIQERLRRTDSADQNLFTHLYRGFLKTDGTPAVNHEDELVISRTDLDALFQQAFGEDLKERVFGRYEFKKVEKVTLKLVKELMIGAAANVTETDLKKLFATIKGDAGRRSLGCSLLLSDQEVAKLRAKESFDQLAADEIYLLEMAFRMIPVGNTRLPILDHFTSKSLGSFFTRSALKEDVKFLNRISSLGEFDYRHMPLAVSEYEGKRLIYVEPSKGLIYPSYNTRGEPVYFANLYGWRQDIAEDAVYYSLSREVNPSPDHPRDVHLNFRGTQFKLASRASGASLENDFARGGVGIAAFEKREADVLEQVKNVLRESGEQGIHLKINGHSLGGGYSQYALNAIVREMSLSKDPLWARVKEISVTTHNSVRVPESYEDRFKGYVHKLCGDELNAMRPDLKGKIAIDLVQYETDIIQVISGKVYLGHKSPDIRKRVHLLSNPDRYGVNPGNKLKLHQTDYFTVENDRQGFTYRELDEEGVNNTFAPIIGSDTNMQLVGGVLYDSVHEVGRFLLANTMWGVFNLGRLFLGSQNPMERSEVHY